MKKIILLLMVMSISLLAITDQELAKTIDLAGKQRMLTQKMNKEAYMIALGINLDESIIKLKKSKELFAKTLNGLISGDKDLGLVKVDNKKIQYQLNKIANMWKPFKANIEKIYDFKAGDKEYIYINRNSIKLLNEMNKAVLMYTALNSSSSNFKLANDINLAGKERMLTQKIAKDILQNLFGIEQKTAMTDLKNTISLFDKIINGLYKGDKQLHLNGTKLPKIINQLKVIQKNWQESKRLIDIVLKSKNQNNQELVIKIINSLDKVRYEMNKCVTYYTQSLNRHKQVLKLNQIIGVFLKTKDTSKHIINLAGKQRMLTQKISKLAIECRYKLINTSCKKIKKSIYFYDKTLNGFMYGDKELNIEDIKLNRAVEKIKDIHNLWNIFKVHADQISNSKEHLNYIITHNEELLKKSNQLVKILEADRGKSMNYIGKSMLNIINIAGRERMLTQKMTKEKISIIYVKMKYFEPKLKNSVKMFDDSLVSLINGNKKLNLPKVTNTKIATQLLKVNSIWKKLKPFYLKRNLSKREMTLLLKANPILLKEMDKAVSIIENSTEY